MGAGLTLPDTVSPGLIIQKARGHPAEAGLPQFVGIQFQILFHSPSGVLFTVRSRYLFTIGRQVIFSLSPWSGRIHTRFPEADVTWGNNQKR